MFLLVTTFQCIILLTIALLGDWILSPTILHGSNNNNNYKTYDGWRSNNNDDTYDNNSWFGGIFQSRSGRRGGGRMRSRMIDCSEKGTKLPLLIGGSDGSGTRAFVDIVKQLGVTVVADDKTTFDIHGQTMFRGEGWPALVNRILKETHSGNYLWDDLSKKLQQTIEPEVNRLFTNINNRCSSMKLREQRTKNVNVDPTSTTVSYAIKAPVSMLVLPVIAQFINSAGGGGGGGGVAEIKRFKFLHVIRDGRDVALSSNQSPVAKFYNTTYIDYKERSKLFKSNLQRVKAAQLWNDWNIQVYDWAIKHSSSSQSSSSSGGGGGISDGLGGNHGLHHQLTTNTTLRKQFKLSPATGDEDIIVDYLIMRSEDLLDPEKRLECLLKLAEFVGSTIDDNQLCCISNKKTVDFGASGQHYKDGKQFNAKEAAARGGPGRLGGGPPGRGGIGFGGSRQHPAQGMLDGFAASSSAARKQKVIRRDIGISGGVDGVSGEEMSAIKELQKDLTRREHDLEQHEHELEEKEKGLQQREHDLEKREAELLARFNDNNNNNNNNDLQEPQLLSKEQRRRLSSLQQNVVGGDSNDSGTTKLINDVHAYQRLVATGKETAEYHVLNDFMARGAELIHLLKRKQLNDVEGPIYDELQPLIEQLARQVNALEAMAAHARSHPKNDHLANVKQRYGKWMAVLANDTELSRYFHQEEKVGLELFGYEPRKVVNYTVTTTDRETPLVCSDSARCPDDEVEKNGGGHHWLFH